MTAGSAQTATAVTCALRSRARGEDMIGTAPPADRFLLIEDPGPWGDPPHPVGGLPGPVVEHARQQATRLTARLLLVRRPGRRDREDTRRTWAFAHASAPSAATGVRTGQVARPLDLAGVDFATDGRVEGRPWFLVCTQGRHDVCCAVYGRPVAAAMARVVPDRTWEVSHVGGDRFAANVLVLPGGWMYGGLGPDSARELVAAHSAGRVLPAFLRGRCGTPPAAQVAERAVRTALAADALDAVWVESVQRVQSDGPPAGNGAGPVRWTAQVRHAPTGRLVTVDLTERPRSVAGGLTCASLGPGQVTTWQAAVAAADHRD